LALSTSWQTSSLRWAFCAFAVSFSFFAVLLRFIFSKEGAC
jgi:hypothetical protein